MTKSPSEPAPPPKRRRILKAMLVIVAIIVVGMLIGALTWGLGLAVAFIFLAGYEIAFAWTARSTMPETYRPLVALCISVAAGAWTIWRLEDWFRTTKDGIQAATAGKPMPTKDRSATTSQKTLPDDDIPPF